MPRSKRSMMSHGQAGRPAYREPTGAGESLDNERRIYTNGNRVEPATRMLNRPAAFLVEKLLEYQVHLGPCPICHTPLEPAGVHYQYPMDCPVVEHQEPVPGSKCPRCEAEFLDPEASLAVEEAALDRLKALHVDKFLSTPLRQSVKRWHMLLDR
jgi:hypothetical protein